MHRGRTNLSVPSRSWHNNWARGLLPKPNAPPAGLPTQTTPAPLVTRWPNNAPCVADGKRRAGDKDSWLDCAVVPVCGSTSTPAHVGPRTVRAGTTAECSYVSSTDTLLPRLAQGPPSSQAALPWLETAANDARAKRVRTDTHALAHAR